MAKGRPRPLTGTAMTLMRHNGYTLLEALFTLAIFAVSIMGFRIWVDAMGEAWDVYTTVRGFEDVRDKVYAYYYQHNEWPIDIVTAFSPIPPNVVPSTRSGEDIDAEYGISFIERWTLTDPDRPHWYDPQKHNHLQISVKVSTALMANKICAMLGPLSSVGQDLRYPSCDAPATGLGVPVNLRILSPGVTAVARYAYSRSGKLEMLQNMRVAGGGLFDLCRLIDMSVSASHRICDNPLGYAMALTHEIPKVPAADGDPTLFKVPSGQLLECVLRSGGDWVWEPVDGDGVTGAPDFWLRLQSHHARVGSTLGC